MKTAPKTPPADAPKFLMPAEWEPHEATWIAWPHNEEDWPGRFEPIPWVYAEIVRRLAAVETVNICIQNKRLQADATDKLQRAGADLKKVRFHAIPTDRVWTRDSGPIFAFDVGPDTSKAKGARRRVATCWKFNAWAKYDNHKRDRWVGHAVADAVKTPAVDAVSSHRPDWRSDVVMEGGAIDVNGAGTLLCTEECLLSKKQERNPGFKRADYEHVFQEFLGARHVIWLGKGVVGDDTHGHVDDLARFVNKNTVVVVQEDDPKDANHKLLKENWERLQSATDQDGKRLKVVALPMPEPVVFEGQRLPASYANFYIANGLVLVPTFNDPRDREALGILSELFPDRQVVGIHCTDFVWGLGTLHCMTQQQPAV